MIILIDIPVFYASVTIYIGDHKNTVKSLPKWFDRGSGYMARTCFNEELPGSQIVIHSKTAALSVIAHEALHAVNMILDNMGVQSSFDNDEVQAYMVQYIIHKVEEKLYKGE